LATVCCALCLASACGRTPELQVAALPQTAAGQCAAAYFDAFNSDGDEMLLAFVEQFRSPSYLESHPVEERLAHHKRLQGTFGGLTPVRVAFDLELQLTLLVNPEEIGGALVMRFHLNNEAPHRLAYITFSGIDHFEVSDAYVGYVATRAAPVDETLRASSVQAIAESLRDVYVYPKIGQRMAAALLRNQAEGLYDDLATAGTLAERLAEDALDVSNDLHIWVEAQNPMAQASTDPVNRDVSELQRDNYDFREVSVLPGNIGYIKFDMIHDDEEAQEIAASALGEVARCEALILDLRDNIGGEWGTAGLILGYVLPGGTVLSHSYDRDGNCIGESSVPQMIPGEPFADDVPVYVLTSGRTGSAAEALAYKLKHTGRATLVGEVTRGAAHASEEVVVNDYFRVSIPFRRSENVITGTNWEGVGVLPQIEVAADDALEAAVSDARQRIGNGQ
jgi:hypothetical protein